MAIRSAQILEVLDRCSEEFTFPALDNGYVYPAAARLSLHRSAQDWALVIETFGFSPREGLPSIQVSTFASRLHARNQREQYASEEAYRRYLAGNPHNESRFFHPIDEGAWQDSKDLESVASGASTVLVRGKPRGIPQPSEYAAHGVILEDPPRVAVFELCRYLASVVRNDVLATEAERRINVPPELQQILVLDEWNHPDVVASERPSDSVTFQQLARVLETGSAAAYRPTLPPNTHWSHWPEGGRL